MFNNLSSNNNYEYYGCVRNQDIIVNLPAYTIFLNCVPPVATF